MIFVSPVDRDILFFAHLKGLPNMLVHITNKS